MMHTHHQHCPAAHDKFGRAKASRPEIVEDGERGREKSLPDSLVHRWWASSGRAGLRLRRPYLYAVQIVLKSMYLSIACGERSRPKPDCLKPPNGVASDERS